MDTKTVLVTGGAGFIGSHLIDRLLASGYSVVCVDNLITGSKDNLSKASTNPNFSFLEFDVSKDMNNATIKPLDFIFHLASPASVVDYQKYSEETARVNSVGTMSVLELARKDGARFLFASTSEVYGDPREHPQKETYWGNVNPNGVRSCYDESKRFAEAIIMVYARKYDLDARIARIFNTYGPRMRKTDGRVVSNLINQAIEGRPLTVYGNGTQTRSFCFVTDLVDGLVKLMLKGNAKKEVVNLGNPEEYTVIDLANKIKTVTGSNSEIVFEKLPEDDPVQRRPDITKAKNLLGWQPKVSVEEGLKKTIEYYKKVTSDK